MGESSPWASSDPLGEGLHCLRMSGTLYTLSELSAPWGLALPALEDCLMFHVVMSGTCRIEVEGVEPRMLRPGDLALVPHGKGHDLVSERGARTRELFDLRREEVSERYEILRHGGGGARTTMLCGAVRFDHPAARRLIDLLPPLIVLDSSRTSQRKEWVESTLRFISAEARELRPGGETVITRLADILVIEAIREWIAEDPSAQTGWLGALRDPRVGRAIALIHREPERPWTVATLAREVAMSRSSFSARFHELVGEPVMQYLARWRMNLATTLLRESDVPLADLSIRLGYQSEAAFSRAFKRHMGVSPGAVRQRSETHAVSRPPDARASG